MATNVERIKWVEGTAFLVDGFSYTNPAKCQHYFLTHFHSDHTWGLRPSFSAGIIYCSEPTAALLIGKMGLQPQFVRALPLRKPTWIQGVEVTLLCANHCPGAVQFLFRVPTDGNESSSHSSSKKRPLQPWEGKGVTSQRRFRTILHTGDCRAAPEMVAGAVAWLKGLKQEEEEEEEERAGGAGLVDVVYLDTTYCNPKHTFPSQPDVLAAMARIAQQEKTRDPHAVFYVGCYSIGKERAVRAVAEAIGSKVYADGRKERVLRLAGEWDDALFSREIEECAVRMSWLGRLRPDRLKRDTLDGTGAGVEEEEAEGDEDGEDEEDDDEAPKWEEVANGEGEEEEEEEEEPEPAPAAGGNGGQQQQQPPPRTVVGFRPTGWCYTRASKAAAARGQYRPWVDEAGRTRLYCVPYSEHSSFPELQAYVRALKPRRIIPTVNAGDATKVEKMLRHFLKDMDLSHDKGRLDAYFTSAASCSASSRSSQTTTTVETTTGAGVVVKSISSSKRTSTTSAFFGRRRTTGGGVVDLAAVDVEEQKRLWAAVAKTSAGKQEEEDSDRDGGAVGWEAVEDEEEQGEEEAAVAAGVSKRPAAVITIDDSDSD